MIEELLPVVSVSVVGAIFANIAVSFLKNHLSKNENSDAVELEDGKHQVIAKLPLTDDLASIERRIIELEKVSSRLAVLEGWEVISKIILKDIGVREISDTVRSGDIISIARQIPGIQPLTIDSLAKLKRARNLVAHSAVSPESEAEITVAAKKLLPLLRKISAFKET